mmetsp:Transcript_13982/g.40943  ORF Transcript_13982/g.40943 Transcript_13982/m.40943 type:complete len:463 (-) Transcript_13982:44-1432(-)
MRKLIEDYALTIGFASHLCSPDYMFHLISPIAKKFMGGFMRKRFRVHYGSTDDVLQSLAEYSLHKDQLPTELEGSLHLDTEKWLSERRLLEGTSSVGSLQDVYLDASAITTNQMKPSLHGVDSANHSSSALGAAMDGSSGATPNSSPPPRYDNVEESSSEICKITAVKRVQHRKTKQFPPGDRDLGRKKTKFSGGDPRMNRAIRAKTMNPDISAHNALVAGGFCFPDYGKKGLTDKNIMDEEGVSLYQRKNQLRRRLRTMRMADPRIVRAALTKRDNSELTMLDALLAGGFHFPNLGTPDTSERTVRDTDGVPLSSRKIELTNKVAELKGVCTKVNLTGVTSTADDMAANESGILRTQAQTIQSRDRKLYDENTSGICANTSDGSILTASCNISNEQNSSACRKDSFLDRISNILEPPVSYVAEFQGGDYEGSLNTWLLSSEENGDFLSAGNCISSQQDASC